MDNQPGPHQELPELYRAILDGVMLLERAGERREAALIRSAAIASYSTAWDERTLRKLRGLLTRVERVSAGRARPRRANPRSPLLLLRRAVASRP